MENIKVRVNNEAESKEVQELLFELGAVWYWNKKQNVENVAGFINLGMDMTLTSGSVLNDNHQELTIPQLRDLVVLKRNDVVDATHTNIRTNTPFLVQGCNEYFYLNNKWVFSECPNDLKPIEKKEMKEFLVNHNDEWTLQLLDADTEENSFRVAVPSGAEYMTMPNRFFWKDGDVDHAWFNDGRGWNNDEGESMQEYLRTSYSASIGWQRHETKEFLNSKAGYVLQVLPAHAGDDAESGLIEVPEGAEVLKIFDDSDSGFCFYKDDYSKIWQDFMDEPFWGCISKKYKKRVKKNGRTLWQRNEKTDSIEAPSVGVDLAELGTTDETVMLDGFCASEVNFKTAMAFNAVRGTNLTEDDVHFILELSASIKKHFGG